MRFDITVSIVLFKNERLVLSEAIKSVLSSSSLSLKLYLIDNSPFDELRNITSDPRSEYIFNERNLGFGPGHNLALKKSLDESNYHLVLNPDVYFGPDVLNHLHTFLENNQDVGQVNPKILFPNGERQHSGKLLPTPWDLIGRRFLRWFPPSKKRNDRYELRGADHEGVMNVPQHLGCFMLIRTAALRKSGLFDESIFMYTEDIDLTRRIHRYYKTLYYPHIHIYHHKGRGSRRNLRLFLYHVRSVIIYFNKWGWLVDKERSIVNKSLIAHYLH